MLKVGNIIRERRKGKNLLLRHLSAILDIDVAILSKIERGERTASKELLIKISRALEIDTDLLLQKQIVENILSQLEESDDPIGILKIVQEEIKEIL
jgi:transcriptional regulator with XRE-family HTH domain